MVRASGRGEGRADVGSPRENLLRIARAEPGLGIGELRRKTGLAWGVFYHHLHILEDDGSVRLQQAGRRRLVFPATIPAEHAGGLELLASGTARAIATAICEQPGLRAVALAEVVGVSKRVAYQHVRRLVRAGLVTSASATRYEGLQPSPKLRRALQK